MILKSAAPINDMEIKKALQSISSEKLFGGGSPSPAGEYREPFINGFENWLPENNSVSTLGIEKWTKYVTSGTTGSFLNFNLQYPSRQTYVLKGEYPFHKMCGAQDVDSVGKIPSTAKVILSYPFSATGNIHPETKNLLKHCEENKIPVMLDFALINIACVEAINVDQFPAVVAAAYSLSKSFSSGRFPSGICYSREPWWRSPMAVTNEWSYLNHLSLHIHVELFKIFDAEYLWNKYRDQQIKICESLEVEPSSCLLFGLSDKDKYKEYSRSGVVNRLCLSRLLEEL